MKPVSILMEEILDKLVEEDHHHMFIAPVDEADYNCLFKESMDLQKMRRNLKEGKYKRVADLRADFRLMVHNCYKFNKDNPFLYNYCMRIWLIGSDLISSAKEAETEINQVKQIEWHIADRNEEIEQRQKELEQLEREKGAIQDELFAEFCTRVGIRNIREYEQREMRIQEEYERAISGLNNQLDRLKYEMEYLRSEDRQANVRKEEEKLKELKAEKKRLAEEFKRAEEEFNKLEAALRELRKEANVKREEWARASLTRAAKDAIIRAMQRLEQQEQEEESKMLQKKPQVNQKKQQLAHIDTRLEAVRKAYEKAKLMVDTHDQQYKQAEAQMKELEREKPNLEKKLTEESQKQGVNLNKQDVADYRRLKAEVEKRCTMISTELDNKQREQEAANNANEFDKQRLQQSREKMEQRARALEREKRNKLALEEAQRNQEKLLEEERRSLKDLQASSTKTVVGAQQKPRKRKSALEKDGNGKRQRSEEAATAMATDGLPRAQKERAESLLEEEMEDVLQMDEEMMEEEEGDGCARSRMFRRRTKDRGGHKPEEQPEAAAAFADEPFTAAKKEVKKGGRAVAERKGRKESGEEAVEGKKPLPKKKSGEEAVEGKKQGKKPEGKESGEEEAMEGKKPLPKKNNRRDQRSFSISSSLYVGLSRCSSSSSTSVEDIQEEDNRKEEAVIQSCLALKKLVEGKMAQFGEELAKQRGQMQKMEEEK